MITTSHKAIGIAKHNRNFWRQYTSSSTIEEGDSYSNLHDPTHDNAAIEIQCFDRCAVSHFLIMNVKQPKHF